MVTMPAMLMGSAARRVRAAADDVSIVTVTVPGRSMRATSALLGGAPVLQFAPRLQFPGVFAIHSTTVPPTATTALAGDATAADAVIIAPPLDAAVTVKSALVVPALMTTDAGTE